MKEKIKIAKLINRQHTEGSENHSGKDFRYSLRGNRPAEP